MILEEIKESEKDLKKFGLTVGIALLVLAALLFFTHKNSAVYFCSVGFLLVILGFIAPKILKPLNKIWMTFSVILGWIMTRVILTILFYFAITPIGLLTKLFRTDFLEIKIDKKKKSYWLKREKKKFDPLDYERQF